ncbi:MAG: hypothetical protein MUF64_26840 [Polyangiaceae bacterium]|jgi:hypothetical protein|nr:hypothetical protein [Polyangiaceae bacterium]
MMARSWLLLLGLAGVSLAGCGVDAPTYPSPGKYAKDQWALEPGFDPGVHQVARWICLGTLPDEERMFVPPRVDLVLVNQPGRGLLLHDVTTDRVMMPRKTITGGGIEFTSGAHVAGEQETNRYIVPPDYQEEVTRLWTFHLFHSIFTYKERQSCKPGPPVRFL